MRRALCWIRRDLRLHDHAALSEATRQAEETAVIFVFDRAILDKLQDKDDKRLTFIIESLREIEADLKKRGSRLIIRYGNPVEEIPKTAKDISADAVFTNRDYEPSAKKRDEAVGKALSKLGKEFHTLRDQVIFEGRELLTGQGEPYKVYTPYKHTWLSEFKPERMSELKPQLKNLAPSKILSKADQGLSYSRAGFTQSPLWLEPGEAAGRKRLKRFSSSIDDYQKGRDIPSKEDGTSGLSVHFRFGTVSIREAVRFAKEHRSQGARVWLSELIWRDFYQMILDQFPHVTTGAFKKDYDKIKWPGKNEHFQAWTEGRTGFPLVDAAMRHFAETGWMHNRLRMVVASFLTKDLLVDWRKGEAWFARKLLDFDLAANNGGWQWSASTGCDAQPYFRIFNPVSQSEKFDPEGKFIRAHVKELSGLPAKHIHWPHTDDLFSPRSTGYPPPLVDHSISRIKAIELFKKAKPR